VAARPAIPARRLLALDALARAREARPSRLAPLGLGLALAAAVAASARYGGAASARRDYGLLLWVAIGVVVLGAPFRLLWRQDTPLLSRLPIGGAPIYRLLTVRGLRVALGAALALFCASLPALFWLGAGGWARLAVATVLSLGCAAAVAPAATAVGVALAASTTVGDTMGYRAGGAGTFWLALVPAVAAGGAAALAVLLGPWSTGATPLPLGILVASVGGAALLHLGGEWLGRAVLPVALREFAENRIRMAHVDLVTARGLEAVWGRVAGAAARPLYRKNVAVLRRRYPAYYIATGAAILVQWGATLWGDELTRRRFTLGLAVAVATYAVVAARRLTRPPVEHPRLRATLPLSASAHRRADVAVLAWRVVVPLALGAGPALARAARPGPLVGALAVVAALALGAGAVAIAAGTADPAR
jgi:hypothetical protein